MGVITAVKIPPDTVFGPIATALTLTDPTLLIGHMTSDNRPDVHTVKMDLLGYAEGARTKEWVPYVQAARDVTEQNMEAFLREGTLHYRSTRGIAAGEQVLVWYSRELAAHLGVPDLTAANFKENGILECTFCGEKFAFPFSLRAHLRFRCAQRPRHHGNATPPAVSAAPLSAGLAGALPGGVLSGGVPPVFRCMPPLPPLHPAGSLRSPPADVTVMSSPSSSSGESSSYSNFSPSRDHQDSDKQKSPSPGRKRHLDDQELPLPLKRRLEEGGERETSPLLHSPGEQRFSEGKVDQNQNIDQDDGGSAFKKVEKGPSALPPNASPPFPGKVGESFPPGVFPPPGLAPHRPLGGLMERKEFPLPGLPPVFGRFSMIPSLPLTGMLPAPLTQDLGDVYRGALTKHDVSPRGVTSDRLPDMRGVAEPGSGSIATSFLPAHAQNKLMPAQNYGFFKSTNPMVERLLASTASPLSLSSPAGMTLQNWCAKCNATFRMTSDLVYHMRSHHQAEQPDPGKRKREDKLHCEVCGETFRERHHLTRHMSSHA